MEEWKPFKDGHYEISNCGNVRRSVPAINSSYGRLKALCVNSSGYKIFGHNVDGKRLNIYVHRAVAECFLGAIPNAYVVNHKDGDKLNNNVENLEIVTVSENSIHAVKNGLSKIPTKRLYGDNHWTRKTPEKIKTKGDMNGSRLHPESIKRGSQCKSSKLNEYQVSEIKCMLRENISEKEIAIKFNVTRENINSIKNNKSWRHVK